jgi:Nucleotidyl transferase AbiEii toxin, Type IV TA system
MTLHNNKNLFKEAISATATQKKLPAAYIEKDYWITLALYTIFHDTISSETVFKGGTALSKCYQVIERFSEDIDIAIIQREGDSSSKMDRKVEKAGKSILFLLPEIVTGATNKKGNIRKTVHDYERVFTGDLGQVRETIILEVSWLGNFEPYTTAEIQSFVAEMMLNTGQKSLVEAYNLQPFEVKVLTKERTLCEKIMSLVRFSFTETPIEDLNHKVRHIYDIHKLLEIKEVHDFFDSPNFDDMLLKVAADDVKSYKNKNAWLSNHPASAILFADTEKTWNQIKATYNSTFKKLVFGELPTETAILDTLNTVSTRLKSIKWTIEVQGETQRKSVKDIEKKLLSLTTKELIELLNELQ